MKIHRRNSILALVRLERGRNVRTFPLGAQVLSVVLGDDNLPALVTAGDTHAQADEDREFLVMNGEQELPSEVMPSLYYLGTVQNVERMHVFEVDVPRRSGPPRGRQATANLNSVLGGVGPGGSVLQVGQIVGGLSLRQRDVMGVQ